MRIGISAVPPDNVEVHKDPGKDVVFLFKDVQHTTDEDGNELMTANVQKLEYPAGADKADIVAHFDYYFDKAQAEEVKQAIDLKVDIVQKLLAASDYKALKFVDGKLVEAEYAPWRALRQHWRDTVNAMQACKTVEELNNIRYAQTVEQLEQ